jgi:hypothetical protein
MRYPKRPVRQAPLGSHEPNSGFLEEHMRFIESRGRFLHRLLVFRDYLVAVLAVLLAIVLVASPWILPFVGGWRPFVRWYLLPYPLALAAFAIIISCVYRCDLVVRARNRRADCDSQEVKKAA